MASQLLLKDKDARRRAGNPCRSTWFNWTRRGLIPAPIVIQGRNYRSLIELDAALGKLGVPIPEGE